MRKMVTYYLFNGWYSDENGTVYSKKPFAKSESIKKARLLAINQLKKWDKKGHIVGFSKKPSDSPWTANVGAVTMYVDDPTDFSNVAFERPSTALKKGYSFSAIHNDDGIYYILKDGSLGKLHGYN